jgi:hypothetical protein
MLLGHTRNDLIQHDYHIAKRLHHRSFSLNLRYRRSFEQSLATKVFTMRTFFLATALASFTVSAPATTCTAESRLHTANEIIRGYNANGPGETAAIFAALPMTADCPTHGLVQSHHASILLLPSPHCMITLTRQTGLSTGRHRFPLLWTRPRRSCSRQRPAKPSSV